MQEIVKEREVSGFKDFIKIVDGLKDEQDIQQFVYERLAILEAQSSEETISFISNERMNGKIVSGYINSESPIVSSFLVNPFYMNDATLYIEFIKFIKGQDFSDPLQLLHSLQNFNTEAFGYRGNQQNRVNVYLNNDKEKISIGDFYKNKAALCSERSAAIQNLVCFSGMDCYMVLGRLSASDGTKEQHAYNILKMKDGTLILFDSTNPVTLLNGEQGAYIPAYHIFEKGVKIEEIGEVKFDLQKLSSYYNLPLHADEPERTYYTPSYYLAGEQTEDEKVI